MENKPDTAKLIENQEGPKNEEEVKEKETKRSKEERKKSLSFVMGYAKREIWWIVLGTIMMTIGQGASLVSPLLIGRAIDYMTLKEYEKINTLILWYLVIVVISAFAGAWRQYLFNSMSERIAQNLRNDYYVSLVNKDIAFFDERKSGDLLSRLNSDI